MKLGWACLVGLVAGACGERIVDGSTSEAQDASGTDESTTAGVTDDGGVSDGGVSDGADGDDGTPIDPKFCTDADDCVPVQCTCTCSGCGGFSYEDVVHRDSVTAWYEERGCSRPMYCPQVCCPPMTVACIEQRCVVQTP